MKQSIIIIDNYDSFTYNLVHLVRELGVENIKVVRNDKVTFEEIEQYDGILLSPGPGIPSEAGLLKDIILKFAPTKPILGVCLGEQAIGECFGATLINLKSVHHGIQSNVKIVGDKEGLFKGLDERIDVGRYHSWVVSTEDFPEELEITAVSDEGEIMAIRHKTHNVAGIQFHPESILTPVGSVILRNWLEGFSQ
ncbi:MAG: aminodeoxychorismate/anthranilate synthase component II [Rikenellaceae bacterium]